MPTVTAIALDTLLEPGSSSTPHPRHRPHPTSPPPSSSHNNPRHHTTSPTLHHGALPPQRRDAPHPPAAPVNHGTTSLPAGSRARPSANGYYISPKLYVTPEPTRIVPTAGISSSSSSPNSVSSPSPFVVNHKRRDLPRPPPPPPAVIITAPGSNGNGVSSTAEANSRLPGIHSVAEPPDRGTAAASTRGAFGASLDVPLHRVAGTGGRLKEGIRKVGEGGNSSDSNPTRNDFADNEHPDADHEEDSFFDPREMTGALSSSDTEDTDSFCHGGAGMCHTPLTSQSEFYDATEDFFSDGSVSRSSPSSQANIEAGLCSIRLSLFEEIDRRKKAEEALDCMQNMFQRIAGQLSQVGLLFPPIQPGVNMQCDPDSAAQICQEVLVTRVVSEALESGLAQAETEAALEAIIEAKNHEISRLHDRLQYYEAMNQEMSQMNQEAIELSRRRRLKRKVRHRWVWGCIGLSITVGASLMAYSYLMHGGGKNESLGSSDYRDHSSGTVGPEGSPT